MKKLMTLIAILFIASFIQAEPIWYKLNNLSVKIVSEGTWSNWQIVDILMTIDFDKKHVVIYSDETQIIDYVNFNITSLKEGGNKLSSAATDRFYKSIRLEFFLYDTKQEFIKISYNDVEYIYEIVEYY